MNVKEDWRCENQSPQNTTQSEGRDCNNAANRERGNGYEKFGKNRG